MSQNLLRADIRRRRRRRLPSSLGEWLLLSAIVLGVIAGFIAMLLRDQVLSENYEADSDKIWRIASGRLPGFEDQSFTPVANVYRAVGLGDAPFAASLLGYVLAVAVILLALYRAGRRTVGWGVAVYIFGAFVLAGIYLGQYSKDVFVLPIVALLLVLPRRVWWDLLGVVSMLAYAYWFREYWVIVGAGYFAYRLITLPQVRVRYLLAIGVAAAVLVAAAFYLRLGRAPNFPRTSVQKYLDARTFIHPIEPFAQPWGGLFDVFAQYWLLLVPVTLPFTAGMAYVAISLGLAFIRLLPIFAVRSKVEWPAPNTADGVLMRRGLSLFLAFTAVQALFEPDYGSVLRHLAPLLPLTIVVMQTMRAGSLRTGRRRWWSWTGR